MALACGVAPLLTVSCGDAEPTPHHGHTITNSIGMKLVYIGPGSFMMGSPEGDVRRRYHEGPQHRVTITRGFYMGAYEVTQEQYEKVMGGEANLSRFQKGGNYPVEFVNCLEAQDFCKKLSAREGKAYRLPHEAEWEYACRAGTTTAYCCGDSDSQLDAYAWHWNNADRTTHPVGGKQPNAWGLYDMHGNVWEWCYAEEYLARYPEREPPGPANAKSLATKLRGGSWEDTPIVCRCAGHRVYVVRYLFFSPTRRGGFRVVCVPRPSG